MSSMDLKQIAYIKIQNEQVEDIKQYHELQEGLEALSEFIDWGTLITQINWTFLQGAKKPIMKNGEPTGVWLNYKRFRNGKRKGEPYLFMFVGKFWYMITQSRPAGSYKIMGKYKD